MDSLPFTDNFERNMYIQLKFNELMGKNHFHLSRFDGQNSWSKREKPFLLDFIIIIV